MATASLEQRYRGRSLWLDHAPGPLSPRPSLSGDAQFDVAVVGAGFTGLWTAYYVKRDRPDARVAVVEREIAGFGPSGRNGGWVSARIAGSPSVYAERHGPEAVRRAERETFSTVDEIGRVAREERIDCGFEKAGTVALAMTAPQVSRARSEIEAARRIGLGEDDVRVLEASELEQLVRVPGCRLARDRRGVASCLSADARRPAGPTESTRDDAPRSCAARRGRSLHRASCPARGCSRGSHSRVPAPHTAALPCSDRPS